MIENLQDELCHLENKQAKGAKLCTNTTWELESKKCSKYFFKALERQNIQNQTISESCTDDNISKCFCNPNEIFRCEKRFYENLYDKETT